MKNKLHITTEQKNIKSIQIIGLDVATKPASVKVVINKPARRRRHNYAKKIMNDTFLMTV